MATDNLTFTQHMAAIEAVHRTRAMWAAREAKRELRHTVRVKFITHIVVCVLSTLLCMELVSLTPAIFALVQSVNGFGIEFLDRILKF